MAVFSKLVTVATALSSAAAASSGNTLIKLSTHRSHSGPNNTTFVTYHPPTQYETFGSGIDPPEPGWMDFGFETDWEYDPTPEGIGYDFLLDRYNGFESIRLHVLDPPTPPKCGRDWTKSGPESVTHVYFKQMLNGIDVANAVANVAIKDKKIVAYGANFVPKPKYIAPRTPKLTFSEAIVAAEARLGIKYNGGSVKKEYVITDPDTATLTYIVPVIEDNVHGFFDTVFEAVVDAEYGKIFDAISTWPEVKYRILEFMGPDPTGRSMVAHAVDLSMPLADGNQVPLVETESPRPATSPLSETGNAKNVSINTHVVDNRWREMARARMEESHSHDHITRLASGGHRWCLSTTESSGMRQGWINIQRFQRKIGLKTPRDFTISRKLWNDAAEVRSVPYSINMTVNPLTYATVPLMNDVHHIGEVWTTILVEVHWGLIAAKGYAPPYNKTKTGGNTIFRRLFVHGLRIQPCNPTFLTGRDAIIQADENIYGGENKCVLWKAFAKRGLGVNAADYSDDFSVPSEC